MNDKKESTDCLKTSGVIYDVDTRIRLIDGRLYTARTPYNGGVQSGYPEFEDVTDKVLDILLKAKSKRDEEAYQNSILNQLKNK